MGVLFDGFETQMTEHLHTQPILPHQFLQIFPSPRSTQQELRTKW